MGGGKQRSAYWEMREAADSSFVFILPEEFNEIRF